MNYIVNSASRIQQRKNVKNYLMKSSIIWICLSLLYSYLNCPPLTTVPVLPEKNKLYLIPATPQPSVPVAIVTPSIPVPIVPPSQPLSILLLHLPVIPCYQTQVGVCHFWKHKENSNVCENDQIIKYSLHWPNGNINKSCHIAFGN